MSTLNFKKKVTSTFLSDAEYKEIEKLCRETGATRSWIVRGLIRIGLLSYRNRKSTKMGILALGRASDKKPPS